MSKKDVSNKVPIYKLKTTQDIMQHYDKWGDKYDQDMIDWNYTGPKETVNIFKKYAASKDIKIFDAGCGTGLVGVELKKFGYKNIDGADLSKKLLNLIPTGIYNKLEQIDLNKALNKKSNIYDAALCVGTFTFGHCRSTGRRPLFDEDAASPSNRKGQKLRQRSRIAPKTTDGSGDRTFRTRTA